MEICQCRAFYHASAYEKGGDTAKNKKEKSQKGGEY
jgi:hypothetical protein